MTSGNNDTKYIKGVIGSRLQAARGKLSRQTLTDILNSREDRPVIGDEKATLSLETLKKWEYGANPINIEWLPVICDVLDCDIGYLFGEYEEKHRETSDACKVTGLSEAVIERFRREEGNCRKKQLEEILLNDKFWEIINCFCQWENASKGLLEENKKLSDKFKKIVQSGQYPEENESFQRASTILDLSVRDYRLGKYKCSLLFDEIRDTFLPDI